MNKQREAGAVEKALAFMNKALGATPDKCVTCTGGSWPVEFAGDGRASDAHVGVRFQDQFKYAVFLDDVDVTNRAFEAMAGPDGWVALFDTDPASGRRFVCDDTTIGQHPAYAIKHGNVRLAARALADA